MGGGRGKVGGKEEKEGRKGCWERWMEDGKERGKRIWKGKKGQENEGEKREWKGKVKELLIREKKNGGHRKDNNNRGSKQIMNK